MRNVIKEMSDHVPEGFFGFYIFLAAVLAIMALNNRSAVQAIFFFSLWRMAHDKNFLKILTKCTTKPACPRLGNNKGFTNLFNS